MKKDTLQEGIIKKLREVAGLLAGGKSVEHRQPFEPASRLGRFGTK